MRNYKIAVMIKNRPSSEILDEYVVETLAESIKKALEYVAKDVKKVAFWFRESTRDFTYWEVRNGRNVLYGSYPAKEQDYET